MRSQRILAVMGCRWVAVDCRVVRELSSLARSRDLSTHLAVYQPVQWSTSVAPESAVARGKINRRGKNRERATVTAQPAAHPSRAAEFGQSVRGMIRELDAIAGSVSCLITQCNGTA
ncbi:hypothetical protein JOY44_23520 [Phormidium sp. CLA17]|uniref:hypothetical protein n=1 Tax=Leptolyngbya sp. Cla-17 TaxID=2803751 RepID=UPI001492935C|nr:hypothetical protein [Leptolyngbya sp. Cla-17]MBM0744540.1 hypothetical protein [Leptolyngbya sp. Cla-17]